MPKVSITGVKQEFKIKEKESLFNALRKQGKELMHSCLAGSCGSCRIKVVSGSEFLQAPKIIEEGTIKALEVNYERIFGPGSAKGVDSRLACSARTIENLPDNAEIHIEEIP